MSRVKDAWQQGGLRASDAARISNAGKPSALRILLR
jgi:hypothetical protein